MARGARQALFAMLAIGLGVAAVCFSLGWTQYVILALIAAAGVLPALALHRRGRIRAALMLGTMVGIGCCLCAAYIGSTRISAISLLPMAIVIIGLLLDRRVLTAATITVTLGIGAVVLLRWITGRGRFTTTTVAEFVVLSLTCCLAAFLGHLLHRAVENALLRVREHESRYRRIFENIQDVYFEIGPDGKLTEISPAAQSLFGSPRQELLGRLFPEFCADPAQYDALVAALAKYLHVENREMTLLDRAKKPRHVLVHASRNGQGIFGCIRDITDRKTLEDRLNQVRRMESVGALAGGIAHDFNNLLSVIDGYADLILSEPQKDPFIQRARVAEIRKAGERAAGLTSRLLALSREQVVESRPLRLEPVVADLASMLRRMVSDRVELRLELGDTPGFVVADPNQICQCLINLAVNARDAIPSRGAVTLRTWAVELTEAQAAARPGVKPGAFTVLAVADTGEGMTEDVKARIFEPFFTTKSARGGTGLGLSTVYGIVVRSGGWIETDSELGRGTEFRLYFPRVEAGGEEAEEPHAAEPQPPGSATVLLVEDSAELRLLTAAFLSQAGYLVYQASDGFQALALLETCTLRMDLLVADMGLPRMSGAELAARVLASSPSTKAIFVSGSAGEDCPPGFPFLGKPFTREALLEKVRAALRGQDHAQAILLVDDDAAIRRLLAEILADVAILRDTGFVILEAANGREALDRLAGHPVRLMITDLAMPDMDGLELIRKARREFPQLRIVSMSGAFAGKFLKPARILGADATLSKPLSPEAVSSVVAGLIGDPPGDSVPSSVRAIQ